MRVIAARPRPGARIRRAVSRCFIVADGEPILVRPRAFPEPSAFRELALLVRASRSAPSGSLRRSQSFWKRSVCAMGQARLTVANVLPNKAICLPVGETALEGGL